MPLDARCPDPGPRTRRYVTACAAMLGLGVLVGCMSISIGKFTNSPFTDATGALCQEDKVHLPAGIEREVFYPIAYAGPPHLEISNNSFDQILLVEQKEDRFRVRNNSAFAHELTWKARGARPLVTSGTVTPGVTPVVPAPGAPTPLPIP